jgi:FPC/CPF motif-containing protein YcgG
MEERSLLDNTAPPNLTELGNSVEVADYLSQYSLRDISGQYSADCPEGLLVAVGERFSRSRIQEQDGHPILQLVCDSRSQEAG